MLGQRNELTVVTPVRPGHADALRAVLARKPDPGFDACPEVHFARWALLERPAPVPALVAGTLLPALETPSLLFATTFDGPRSAHLANLANRIPQLLDSVYQYCPGYPQPAPQRRPKDIVRYLARHRIAANTFFVGTPGVSVDDMRNEAKLRTLMDWLLDGAGGLAAEDPVHFHLLLRARVQATPELAALLEAPRPVRPRGFLGWALYRIRMHAGPSRWFPPPGFFRRALLGFARETERSDKPPPPGQVFPLPDPQWLAKQIQRMQRAESEDVNRTNRITLYSDVKPGLFRRLLLRMSLFFMNTVARSTLDGRLSGNEQIHSARWVVTDGGRHLLFLSNYDGSWEQYLTAFSKNYDVAHGVTAIWSSADTFPRTRYLVCGGAIHEQPFKQAVRANQIATQFWYSAYADQQLTVEAINRNHRIRCNVAKPALTPEEALGWLEEFH